MKIILFLIVIVYLLMVITPYIDLNAFMAFIDNIGFIGDLMRPIVTIIAGTAELVTQYELVFTILMLTAFPLLVIELLDFL